MEDVAELVGIHLEVVISLKARDELAIEKVVSLVDGPGAPVRVVVRVLAETERSAGPPGWRLPVVVVVGEAVHLLQVASRVLQFGLPPHLPLALLHLLLFDLLPFFA